MTTETEIVVFSVLSQQIMLDYGDCLEALLMEAVEQGRTSVPAADLDPLQVSAVPLRPCLAAVKLHSLLTEIVACG